MNAMNKNPISIYRMRHLKRNISNMQYVSLSYKLCLITQGKAIWQIGSSCIDIEDGDIVILNNRQKRLFKDIISPDGVEMLIVEFESRLFMSQFQGLFASPKEGNVYKISGRDEIKNIFLEIEREEQLRQLHYQRIQKAKVVEMLSMIARVLQIQDLDGIKVTDEMKRIFTYIDENFKDKISLKEAADMLHMSETAFSKHFSKCTGMGFIQYVTQLRISYSIELLRTTQMSVLDIALECGYNNTSSFYQAFKKITHVTPSDYRNENEVMYI